MIEPTPDEILNLYRSKAINKDQAILRCLESISFLEKQAPGSYLPQLIDDYKMVLQLASPGGSYSASSGIRKILSELKIKRSKAKDFNKAA